MKSLGQTLFELSRYNEVWTDGQTDRQTDGRTDRRTDKVITIGLPHLRWRGPKKKRQHNNRKVFRLCRQTLIKIKKRQYNNRKVFRLCRQTLMKEQWREIHITDINFKAQIQDLNYERRFSSTNCTGRGRGLRWFELFSFVFTAAKRRDSTFGYV